MSFMSQIRSLASARYNYAGLSEERTLVLRRNFKRRSILRFVFLFIALTVVSVLKGKYALPLALLVVVSSDVVAHVIETRRNESIRQLMQAQKKENEEKGSGKTSAS
jgi:hypothetical protein